MIVLASHLPSQGHAAFQITRHRVVPVCCEDPFDYWQAFSEWWETDETICNVEHDIEANTDHVDALLGCPHPACAWIYAGHWRTTGQSDDVLAHLCDGRPGKLGDEWADWVALGLIKLAPEARTGPLRREPWMALENAVNDAIAGPVHMHGPAAHHHHW